MSPLTKLPDEKLTQFALRLALTGHTDLPRENDVDFLAQAQAVFAQPEPSPSKKAKTPAKVKPATSNATSKKVKRAA